MPADGQITSRRKPAVTVIRTHPPATDGASARTAAADRGSGCSAAVDGGPVRAPIADQGSARAVAADGSPAHSSAKPTLEWLQVDLAALDWQRSGTEAGSFEVAFISFAEPGRADWVLLRVADDPEGRVLVYDRTEWLCFIDGAGRGEFDGPSD